MEVTVYTTPTCPYCRQVKALLERRGVPYREIDVAADARAAAEMVRLSGQQGVPVTVIDGQVVLGYDQPRIEALLAQAGRPRLGAAVADAAEQARRGRTDASSGAYIGRVRAGGAAQRAGLRQGDVIVALAGHPVSDAAELERLLARVPPGRDVPIAYLRDGRRQVTTIRW